MIRLNLFPRTLRRFLQKRRHNALPEQRRKRADREKRLYASDQEYRTRKRANNSKPENKAHACAYDEERNATPERKEQKRVQRLEDVRRRYGIAPEQVQELLAAQGGACAICRRPLVWPFSRKRTHIDHCHRTGKVRGVLCSSCNRAIGWLGDTAEGVRRAVVYLERS